MNKAENMRVVGGVQIRKGMKPIHHCRLGKWSRIADTMVQGEAALLETQRQAISLYRAIKDGGGSATTRKSVDAQGWFVYMLEETKYNSTNGGNYS